MTKPEWRMTNEDRMPKLEGTSECPVRHSSFLILASSLERSDSVLGRTFRAHLHDARTEFAEHVHEVGLCGHDAVDVFVHAGHFVDAGAEEFDAVAAAQREGQAVVGLFVEDVRAVAGGAGDGDRWGGD